MLRGLSLGRFAMKQVNVQGTVEVTGRSVFIAHFFNFALCLKFLIVNGENNKIKFS